MIVRRDMLAGIAAIAALPSTVAASAGRVLTASIAVENGRVLMAVGMNGQGPFVFMIDTGGVVSLVRDDLAKRLKLAIIGHSALGGMGQHDIYQTYRADNFVIGGVWKQAQVALVGTRDLAFGPDVLGTMAAGLLTVADTDLDFDNNELRLYPNGRGARPGFTRIPSTIRRIGGQEGSPFLYADVVLDGQTFQMLLDTGSPRPILLSSNAARRTRYWDDARPYVPTRPRGLGGTGPLGRIVRAGRLDFGGLTVAGPLVFVDRQGTGRNEFGDGIIGLPLIRRFNVSVDTRARGLWLQPSGVAAEPERYALSGLWLEQSGDAVVVRAVGTGSPGAAAGVAVDDRIVGLSLDAAIRAIGGAPGSSVPLTIERAGNRRSVVLALRPYL